MTLAELVARSGKTHALIIAQTGVSKAGFYNWMSGRTTPKDDKVEALASALGVAPQDIKPSWGQCTNGHTTERDAYGKCVDCRKDAQIRYRPNKAKNARSVRQDRKLRVQGKYGGKCVCCSETEPAFLTVDHVNGSGNAHRQTVRGDDFYKWLDSNSVSEEYVLMCFNCNTGRWVNGGTCPHRAVGGWPFAKEDHSG